MPILSPLAIEALIQDRRALHRIPELGLDLPRTAEYCERALRGLGLAPRRMGDGLTVDLGDRGPLFAWRADMDALPVAEAPGLDYASTLPGRMHACGHDAHMAIALAVARHYATGAELPCRLRLIFQPGEEGAGGARHMIQGGALDGVAAIAGLHVGAIFPELPLGCYGTRQGTVMGSATFFTVTFQGRGTHGATPDQGADPLVAASQFAAALQTIRASAASPVHPTVVSLGSLHSGAAANVIPEDAVLQGTLRTTSAEDLAAMNRHLERLAQGIAMANGVTVRVDSALRAPITANTDPVLPGLLATAVAAVHGPDRFRWLAQPTLVGEDFGAYLEAVPGVFFFLATHPRDCSVPHHHPGFRVEEAELPGAVAVVDALLHQWADTQATS